MHKSIERQLLTSLAVVLLAGCVQFQSNPIPPSVELSLEQLQLDEIEPVTDGVDFGLEARANESDSLANIEVLPGLKVFNVHPNGPADFAGIRVNDVILSVDGVETNHVDVFQAIAERLSPAQNVLFVIRRGTTVLEATVVGRQAKRSTPQRELYRVDPIASRAAFRTEIVKLGNGAKVTGAAVVQMDHNSPLNDAGILIGDVITAVDAEEVRSAQSLVSNLVEDYSPGSEVSFEIISKGETIIRQVRLWDPGKYLSRVQLWPLFRYEYRPDPRNTIFQVIELFPIYRMRVTEFEATYQFLFFFSIRNSRTRPDAN